nr:hypothetical protein [Methanoculleus sp.]
MIIVFDAPTEVVVAGTVLAGFLALVVTGALDLAELKPSRLRSALQERKEKKKQQTSQKAKNPEKTTEKPSLIRRRPFAGIDLSSLSGMLGTLAASVRETITHARAPEGEKKSQFVELDAMLDQAVGGTVPDPSITPAPPKAGGGAVDPLASLADLDLDALEDIDLDGEASGPGTMFESDQFSLLSGEDADAISEILKSHQSDLEGLELDADLAGDADDSGTTLPPIDADIPELPAGDEMSDMSALSEELSALDELDLDEDEIEIEGEEEEEEEVDTEEPVPDEELLEEIEGETKEDFDMVSFASGGAVDDDLISELKSDAKKKKFVEDISLVRDLKGEKYYAKDLVAELEDVLAAMKPER